MKFQKECQKMKRKTLFITIIAMLFVFSPLTSMVQAQNSQGKIIASIDFDPKSDGFGFRNYGGRGGSDDR